MPGQPTAPAAVAIDDLFADNLFAVRREHGVSRRVLAERTGIPIYTIEKIETGQGCRQGSRRRATAGEVVVLALALGVQPGDLLKERQVAPIPALIQRKSA